MAFAFGSLGLGAALVALVALFTRQAYWVFAIDLVISVYSLWEVFGTFRKRAAQIISGVLILSALLILVLGDPAQLALGNFLLGSGYLLASSKYHYEHPAEFKPGDRLGRFWARLIGRPTKSIPGRGGLFAEEEAPHEWNRIPAERPNDRTADRERRRVEVP